MGDVDYVCSLVPAAALAWNRDPSTDSIFLLRILELWQQGLNFDFSWKLRKWKIFEKMWNFLYRLAIFMSLYGFYLSNPSTDLIFLLHMERTYIGAVQRVFFFFFFFWKLKNGKNWKLVTCYIKIFMFTTLYCPSVSRFFLYNYVKLICLHSAVYHVCAIVVRRGT